MDLLDLIIIIVECVAIGFGMEIGAFVAKAFAVRLLNSSAVAHDAEDEAEEEAEEEEEKTKRRRRGKASRGQGGPSTSAAVRVM
jgi:hypothetical protein